MSTAKKQRTSFQTSFGTFTAVQNTKFIQAISDERDKACMHVLTTKRVFRDLHIIVNGESLTWAGHHGFDLPMLEFDDGAYEATGWYQVTESLTEKFSPRDLDYGRIVSMNRCTGVWEALTSGGVFVELSDCPEYNRDPDKAKRIARIIMGNEKAAIAESLTEKDKIEFRAFVAGMNASFTMASVPPAVGVQAGDDDDDYDCGGPEMYHALFNWIRERAAACKGHFPPKFYKLVCEPDERPWLIYRFAREVFDHFQGDYTRTVDLFVEAGDQVGQSPVAPGEVPLYIHLDDTTIPIKDRVKLVKRAVRKQEERMKIAQEARLEKKAISAKYPRPELERERKQRFGKEGRAAIKSAAKLG